MGTAIESLYQAALSLSEDQRAELADRLIDSLPPTFASQLHPAWRLELARRSAQWDAGEIVPIPWSEVQRQAWDAVDQDRAYRDG